MLPKHQYHTDQQFIAPKFFAPKIVAGYLPAYLGYISLRQ